MGVFFDPHEQIYHGKNNRRYTRLLFYIKYIWNRYFLKKKIYALEAWVSASWGRVEHNNWGDDINLSFISSYSKDCLLPSSIMVYPLGTTHYAWLNNSIHVSVIGSILHLINNENTIVWGSGLLSDDFLPKIQLKNIKAVRGPLTRRVLLENNIECPEIYGDPALLLPYYYKSKKQKKYKLGIVPHYVDSKEEVVRRFRHEDGVLVIDMFNYHKWTEIIDKICSCEFVVSSSLHGIIVAEAYNIPNAWIEINQPIVGDIKRRFKFHDFFLSVGLDRTEPYVITNDTTVEKIILIKDGYQPAPGISLKPLMSVCPFRLSNPIKPVE